MNIGRILENENRVKFHAKIICTKCGKIVPGGLQTGESYYNTKKFHLELEDFKKNYL